MRTMRIALITACFGAYDPVRPLPEWHGFDDAVCVTDDASVVGDGWRIHVDNTQEPPRLAAKRPKMLPWLFTDCDAAVWLDASFEITGRDIRKWAEAHIQKQDFTVWRHPEGRIDFIDEAKVCWDWPKYAPFDIRGQVAHYVEMSMPRAWGLFACGTIGWKFTPAAKRLGALWHAENVKWSIQDQVSLPYVLWSTGIPFGLWDGNEYDNRYVRLRWDERPNPSK